MRLYEIKQLNEGGISRMINHLKNHDGGTISAFRNKKGKCNEGEPYSKKEKLQRNVSLSSKLRNAGFFVTSVKGIYSEIESGIKIPQKENSFLVADLKDVGNLRKVLMELGEYFDQDSVLFIPKGFFSFKKGGKGIYQPKMPKGISNEVNDAGGRSPSPTKDVELIGTSKCPGSDPAYHQSMKFKVPVIGRERDRTVNGEPIAKMKGFPGYENLPITKYGGRTFYTESIFKYEKVGETYSPPDSWGSKMGIGTLSGKEWWEISDEIIESIDFKEL